MRIIIHMAAKSTALNPFSELVLVVPKDDPHLLAII
jgi:hypothetical protein